MSPLNCSEINPFLVCKHLELQGLFKREIRKGISHASNQQFHTPMSLLAATAVLLITFGVCYKLAKLRMSYTSRKLVIGNVKCELAGCSTHGEVTCRRAPPSPTLYSDFSSSSAFVSDRRVCKEIFVESFVYVIYKTVYGKDLPVSVL